MGILWEIVQTGLMYGQKRKSDTIEDRLQNGARRSPHVVFPVGKSCGGEAPAAFFPKEKAGVKKLEELQGADIDGDGKIG